MYNNYCVLYNNIFFCVYKVIKLYYIYVQQVSRGIRPYPPLGNTEVVNLVFGIVF